MTKRENPPTTFMRVGMTLVPADEFAADLLRSLGEGQLVNIDLKQRRNLERLRAYWAMLRDCMDATGCAATVQALHLECKRALGLVEAVVYRDGHVSLQPSSIAFANMGELEFIEYFGKVEVFLAEGFGYGGE